MRDQELDERAVVASRSRREGIECGQLFNDLPPSLVREVSTPGKLWRQILQQPTAWRSETRIYGSRGVENSEELPTIMLGFLDTSAPFPLS
jgi:hypothetical protein